MKKIFSLFFLGIACTLLSCGDDDGVMERPNYTSVSYQLSLSEWFLMYYNVDVTYQDVHGVEHTERIDQANWQFKDKEDGVELKNLYFKAVATARETLPTLGDNIDAITLSCDYRADYYTKSTSAKSIHKTTAQSTIKKENIESYIQSHQEMNLFECKYSNLNTTTE